MIKPMLKLALAALGLTAAFNASAQVTNAAAPHVWPGRGLAQHPFLYAGEWDTRKPDQSMFLVRDGRVYIQAGGGVVADSDPSAEYMETVNKAGALFKAVEIASRL